MHEDSFVELSSTSSLLSTDLVPALRNKSLRTSLYTQSMHLSNKVRQACIIDITRCELLGEAPGLLEELLEVRLAVEDAVHGRIAAHLQAMPKHKVHNAIYITPVSCN